MNNDLILPRDSDGNWPPVLLDLIAERGDTNPWIIQQVIEEFISSITVEGAVLS